MHKGVRTPASVVKRMGLRLRVEHASLGEGGTRMCWISVNEVLPSSAEEAAAGKRRQSRVDPCSAASSASSSPVALVMRNRSGLNPASARAANDHHATPTMEADSPQVSTFRLPGALGDEPSPAPQTPSTPPPVLLSPSPQHAPSPASTSSSSCSALSHAEPLTPSFLDQIGASALQTPLAAGGAHKGLPASVSGLCLARAFDDSAEVGPGRRRDEERRQHDRRREEERRQHGRRREEERREEERWPQPPESRHEDECQRPERSLRPLLSSASHATTAPAHDGGRRLGLICAVATWRSRATAALGMLDMLDAAALFRRRQVLTRLRLRGQQAEAMRHLGRSLARGRAGRPIGMPQRATAALVSAEALRRARKADLRCAAMQLARGVNALWARREHVHGGLRLRRRAARHSARARMDAAWHVWCVWMELQQRVLARPRAELLPALQRLREACRMRRGTHAWRRLQLVRAVRCWMRLRVQHELLERAGSYARRLLHTPPPLSPPLSPTLSPPPSASALDGAAPALTPCEPSGRARGDSAEALHKLAADWLFDVEEDISSAEAAEVADAMDAADAMPPLHTAFGLAGGSVLGGRGHGPDRRSGRLLSWTSSLSTPEAKAWLGGRRTAMDAADIIPFSGLRTVQADASSLRWMVRALMAWRARASSKRQLAAQLRAFRRAFGQGPAIRWWRTLARATALERLSLFLSYRSDCRRAWLAWRREVWLIARPDSGWLVAASPRPAAARRATRAMATWRTHAHGILETYAAFGCAYSHWQTVALGRAMEVLHAHAQQQLDSRIAWMLHHQALGSFDVRLVPSAPIPAGELAVPETVPSPLPLRASQGECTGSPGAGFTAKAALPSPNTQAVQAILATVNAIAARSPAAAPLNDRTNW